MNVALVEELPPNRLARAPLEQHVVGDDDRRPPVLGQDRPDVLDEVELLVAGRRPEVLPDDGQRLALLLAIGADDEDARLASEGRVGQDEVETVRP